MIFVVFVFVLFLFIVLLFYLLYTHLWYKLFYLIQFLIFMSSSEKEHCYLRFVVLGKNISPQPFPVTVPVGRMLML